LSLDALFEHGIDPRPTELLALSYGTLAIRLLNQMLTY